MASATVPYRTNGAITQIPYNGRIWWRHIIDGGVLIWTRRIPGDHFRGNVVWLYRRQS